MMNRPRNTAPMRLLQATQKAIDARRKYAADVVGDPNPQVVAMRVKAQAEADAMQAVLDAMRGDYVALNIYAGDI